METQAGMEEQRTLWRSCSVLEDSCVNRQEYQDIRKASTGRD